MYSTSVAKKKKKKGVRTVQSQLQQGGEWPAFAPSPRRAEPPRPMGATIQLGLVSQSAGLWRKVSLYHCHWFISGLCITYNRLLINLCFCLVYKGILETWFVNSIILIELYIKLVLWCVSFNQYLNTLGLPILIVIIYTCN